MIIANKLGILGEVALERTLIEKVERLDGKDPLYRYSYEGVVYDANGDEVHRTAAYSKNEKAAKKAIKALREALREREE